MNVKIIDDLAVRLNEKVPENYLNIFEEFLLSGAITIEASKMLAILISVIIFLEILFLMIMVFLQLQSLILLLPFLSLPGLYVYVSLKQERRASEIEKSAPDFLRQLASMLKVGLSFENAMEDMSKYGEGPLYDEMRRTILEIRMGRNFDESWIAMSKHLKSKELERVFTIVLDGRKSGSSMSNVIMDISQDLRDLLAIKRERKSSVMTSVMFLVISAIVATPFALGMVGVYSQFMQSYGKTSDLIVMAPVAGQIYLLIHSFLVGFIISVIMDGDVKKGIKYSVPLVFASYGIFYIISNFAGSFFIS